MAGTRRRMTREDLDTVVQLERQIFPDPWSRASFEYEIFQHPFSLPLVLLQVSLLLRLSGDFFYMANLRKAGGVLHAITIALFILVLAASVIRNKKKPL